MSKKLLALLLAMAMVFTVLPFSVFADDEAVDGDTPVVEETVENPYASGLDDTASYLLKIPSNVDWVGQTHHWTTDGVGFAVRHENGENFFVFDEKTVRDKTINSCIYAPGITYGPEDLKKKNEYTGVVPESIDVDKVTYLAMRVKVNDNKPEGDLTAARMSVYLNEGSQNRIVNTTDKDGNIVKMYWLDLKDGSMTRFLPMGAWWDHQGGIEFVGDMDGYMLLPIDNYKSVDNLRGITSLQLYFYDDKKANFKESSWDDMEFLLGDCFLVEDAEKFAAARTPEDVVKYAPNKGLDTAYYAFRVGGYRSFYRTWGAGTSTGSGIVNPNVGITSGMGQIHVTTIAGGDRAYRVKLNTGHTNGNVGLSIVDTYDTSFGAVKESSVSAAAGIPEDIDFSKIKYVASRVAIKGGDLTTSYEFRPFGETVGGAEHAIASGDYLFIDRLTGETSTITYNNKFALTGEYDGWIVTPISAWGCFNTEKYDVVNTWGSPKYYLTGGDWADRTLYAGDMFFVEDIDKFKQFHGAPTLNITAGADSLTVNDAEEGAIYSIDGFETSNTTGVFEGLEKDAEYTISAKYELGSHVATKTLWTDPFATHINDTGYNYMPVPNEETAIKYNKGLGWSSNYFWRNADDTGYVGNEGSAYVHVKDIDGETFIDLTMNPEVYAGKALPICPNISMVPNNLATGTDRFTNTAYNTDDMTHFAFRFKLTGLAEGKVAKLGVLTKVEYFWDMSTAYLIDYDTREVIDPEWTGEQIIFEKNFDGWVVFPIDNMGKDATHNITYKVIDENGDPVFEVDENGDVKYDSKGNPIQKTDTYPITFRESLFAEIDPINGEENAMIGFQFWFHNDDEANNDGVGNEGCPHWAQNSDWRGTTLYMGDMVVFSDKETFDTVRTSCDLHGHELVAGEAVAPTCTEDGYTTYTCKYCEYSENKDIVEALGHAYEEAVTEPDCENGGFTTHTCTVCGDTYDDNFTDALGHTLITLDEIPATCLEGGYIWEMCEICGYTDEYPTVPKGHTWDKGVVTAPTCTEKGFTTYTCTVEGCGVTEVRDEVVATGHNYGEVVTDPTCTDKGYTTHTCSVCGDSYTDTEVEAAGHKYVDTVVPPTETEQGYTDHTCSVCGDNYKDTYTDPVTPEDPEEPEVPATNKITGVTVTPSDIDVTVTWTPRDDVKTYYVRADKPDGTAFRTMQIKDTTASSYTFTGLEYDVEYTFYIYAQLKDGTGFTRGNADKFPASLVIGDRVVGIKASGSGRKINVTWRAYPGADRYMVIVCPKGADQTVAANRVVSLSVGNVTSASIANAIKPEVDYDIYVSPRVNNKYKGLKNALCATTRLPVAPPTGQQVIAKTPGSIRLLWNRVAGADKYWVRLVDEDGNVVRIKESKNAYVNITGLTPNTTYKAQIQARANGKYSGYGDLGEAFATDALEDVIVNVESTEAGKVSVSWNAHSKAAEYYVYRYTGTKKKLIKTISDPTVLTITDKVTSGATYKYGVITRLVDGSTAYNTPMFKSEEIVAL